MNFPNLSPTSQSSNSADSDNDKLPQQQVPSTPYQIVAKLPASGASKRAVTIPLSSWELWTKKNRADTHSASAEQHEEDARTLEEDHARKAAEAHKAINLEDSSFSEEDDAAVWSQRENKYPSLFDTSVLQEQFHRPRPTPTLEPGCANITEDTSPRHSSSEPDSGTITPHGESETSSTDETIVELVQEHEVTPPHIYTPSSYTVNSQRRAFYKRHERQYAHSKSTPNAEGTMQPTSEDDSQQQYGRGKRSRHQADFAEVDSFAGEPYDRRTLLTNRKQSLKNRRKRRCHERGLKLSPLALGAVPSEVEPLIIGCAQSCNPGPLPLPLSTLSLRDRILFSRVRGQIRSLPQPEYKSWRFLIAKPEWRNHPFYCDAGMLTEVYGFVDPKYEGTRNGNGFPVDGVPHLEEVEGEADEDEVDTEGWANGDFAKSIMELCDLHDHLASYEFRYREEERGMESRPVSPKTVEADWEMVPPPLKRVEIPEKEHTHAELEDIAQSC